MFIRLSEEEKFEILEKYKTGKYKAEELGVEYGVSGGCICNHLKKLGLDVFKISSASRRKYTLNEHYFDKIDTEEKAYFLGFLYADGCNSEKRSTISLGLQESDKVILQKLCKELETNKKPSFIKKPNSNCQNQSRLVIHSKIMSKRLVELGCIARKSLILQFPNEEQVPKYLIRHFVRGYFDGDGCITASNAKKTINIRAYIISTENFCLKLDEEIKEQIEVKTTTKRYRKEKTTSIWYLTSTYQTINFLKWIYKDANIFLKRKYTKYLDSIEKLEKRSKERVILFEAFGELKTATEWSRDSRCSISNVSIARRIKKGWTSHDAISRPYERV